MNQQHAPYQKIEPKQQGFLDDPAKYKLIGGAQGGGKSYACRVEAFRSCQTIPRCKGIVLRRSRGEAIKNFVDPLLEETRIVKEDGTSQPYLKWLSSQNKIMFPNGSRIDIGYCENEKDVERYRGLEYDWECIEELTQWPFEWWRKLTASMRTTKAGVRPFFFGSTNPGNIGHAWVKRLFINKEFEKNEKPEDYGMTRCTIYDNPTLMAADPEYLQNLLSLPEKERRARLDGDWDVFEGQYFTEWRRDVHVVRPFIPRHGVRQRIICGDYGYNPNPSAVYWLAQLNSGHVICYRELWAKKLRFDQLAAQCAAMTTEEEWAEMSAAVFDPSICSKESESGNTFEQEFAAVGFAVIPGNNKRIEGANLMHKYLAPYDDPNTGKQVANLIVTENCINLIRTIPELVHDDTRVEDVNTKGDDHGYDGVRYGLMELGDSIGTGSSLADLNEPLKKSHSRLPPSPQVEQYGSDSKEEYYKRQHGNDLDSGNSDIRDIRF